MKKFYVLLVLLLAGLGMQVYASEPVPQGEDVPQNSLRCKSAYAAAKHAVALYDQALKSTGSKAKAYEAMEDYLNKLPVELKFEAVFCKIIHDVKRADIFVDLLIYLYSQDQMRAYENGSAGQFAEQLFKQFCIEAQYDILEVMITRNAPLKVLKKLLACLGQEMLTNLGYLLYKNLYCEIGEWNLGATKSKCIKIISAVEEQFSPLVEKIRSDAIPTGHDPHIAELTRDFSEVTDMTEIEESDKDAFFEYWYLVYSITNKETANDWLHDLVWRKIGLPGINRLRYQSLQHVMAMFQVLKKVVTRFQTVFPNAYGAIETFVATFEPRTMVASRLHQEFVTLGSELIYRCLLDGETQFARFILDQFDKQKRIALIENMGLRFHGADETSLPNQKQVESITRQLLELFCEDYLVKDEVKVGDFYYDDLFRALLDFQESVKIKVDLKELLKVVLKDEANKERLDEIIRGIYEIES